MKNKTSIWMLVGGLAAGACATRTPDVVERTRQASASPDAGAVTVHPAVELAPETPLGGGNLVPTSVAFNGDVYLVVWTGLGPFAASNLFAARFAKNGTLLDLGGFQICSGCTNDLGYGSLDPTVAATPGGFLVIWEGGWATVASDGTSAAHNGNILNPALPTDPPPPASQPILNFPMLACSPSECLVVWFDGGSRVLAGRVDTQGNAIGDNFQLSTTSAQQPTVAWNGTEFLVAWANAGVRVAPGGTVTGAPFTLSGNGITAVTSNGDGFLVGWGTIAPVTAARVAANGSVLDSPALALGDVGQNPPGCCTGSGGLIHPFTVVGSHGGNYKVAWQHASTGDAGEPEVELLVSNVSATGTVSGPTQFAMTNQADGIAITGGSDGYMLVWGGGASGDSVDSNVNPYAAFITDTGVTTTQITGGPSIQTEPAVTRDASEYMVAWAERQLAEIFSARVAPDGRLLDASPITVASGAGDRLSPALASAGSGFAIAWDDVASGTDSIYTARISAAGVVSSAAALAPGADPQTVPSIASNGSDYYVVWQEPTGIHGARLGTDLSLQSGPSLVAAGKPTEAGAGLATKPALASDGTDYLVVWVNEGSPRTVYGARIGGSGTVLDPGGFALGQISAGERPRVAWDGTSYVAVWTGAPGTSGSVHAARVSSGGAVASLDLTSASTASKPSIDALCGTPLAVWQKADPFMPSDVFGTTILPSGSLVTPIADTAADEVSPVISGRSDGALVVYTSGGRAFARLVTDADCAGALDAGADVNAGGASGSGGASSSGGSGGAVGTGGTTGAGGGTIGTGGVSGTGGAIDAGAGGTTSTGGASGTGGAIDAGAGGGVSTGGVTGTGGAIDAGAGGTTSTGGTTATGGATDAGTGGAPGTGGAIATGGTPGSGGADAAVTGGAPGSGGAHATGGAHSTGGAHATGGKPGAGGHVGDAAVDAGSPGGGGGGGCDCRTARSPRSGASPLALLGIAAALLRRRARRNRS